MYWLSIPERDINILNPNRIGNERERYLEAYRLVQGANLNNLPNTVADWFIAYNLGSQNLQINRMYLTDILEMDSEGVDRLMRKMGIESIIKGTHEDMKIRIARILYNMGKLHVSRDPRDTNILVGEVISQFGSRAKRAAENGGYNITEEIQIGVYIVTKGGRDSIMKLLEPDGYRTEKEIGMLMAANNIAPQVEYVDDENMALVIEKMDSIMEALYRIYGGDPMMVLRIINKINMKIKAMHQLGIGHGDLIDRNIVYKMVGYEPEPYIIDWETAYNINNHTWETELYMRHIMKFTERSIDRGTFEEFVNSDFTEWENLTQLIQSLGIYELENDQISPEEEYYIARFSGENSQFYFECPGLVKELKNRLGGEIFSMIKGTKNVYILKQGNNYIDGSGIYNGIENYYKIHGHGQLVPVIDYQLPIDDGTFECYKVTEYATKIAMTMM